MRAITVLDTTLRDGAQGEGVDFSVEDKLRVARALRALGVPLIEGGNPGANPKDAAFFRRAMPEAELRDALVPFGSTCRAGADAEADAGLRAMLDTGCDTVSLFGKSSALHVEAVLRATREENLRMIETSVRALAKRGRRVLFDAEHFFDGFRQDAAYALETLRAAARGGAWALVLCDTNGGAMPEDALSAFRAARAALPDARLGAHCHNDCGLAVALSLLLAREGADIVEGTFTGVGERCGNADLCTLIPVLSLKMGFDVLPQGKLALLTQTAAFVAEMMNAAPDPRAPFVGHSAFAHKGGMHIDGVMKRADTFEHTPPESVGNRRRFLMSEQAGGAAVYARLSRLLPDIARDGEEVARVMERLKQRENRGYSYENADASFDLMALQTLGRYSRPFEVDDFHVLSGAAADRKSAQAYIKLSADGRSEITAAEGDGPVEALDRALRKALAAFFPDVTRMRLIDFKVRVIDAGGTASVVRVLIQSAAGDRAWTTVGVSANIIQACFKALLDSVDCYLLFYRDAGGASA